MSKKHNTKEDTISAHEELNVAWDRHKKQMITHTAIRHPDTHDLTAQSAHGRKVPALLEWVRDASDRKKHLRWRVKNEYEFARDLRVGRCQVKRWAHEKPRSEKEQVLFQIFQQVRVTDQSICGTCGEGMRLGTGRGTGGGLWSWVLCQGVQALLKGSGSEEVSTGLCCGQISVSERPLHWLKERGKD